MRYLYLAVFILSVTLFFTLSCAGLHKNDKVDLALYPTDTESIFISDKKTRAVRILSKDGVLLYRKIFEMAEPMPSYVPAEMLLMMNYAGEHILQCERPSQEDYDILNEYDIPLEGLRDCFVIALAQKASSIYSANPNKKLIMYKTASELMEKYGIDRLYNAYMANAYMQNDVWGMQSASLYYFDRPIDALEPSQTLWLMSLLTLGYLPEADRDGFYGRMADFSGYVTSVGRQDYDKPYLNIEYRQPTEMTAYPQFTSLILQEMEERGIKPIGELTVISGISMTAVKAAEEAVAERLAKYPEGISIAVAVVNYEDSAIEALAASSKTRYRTMQMKRQIGSTFKPMVYVTAFANGFRPNQLILDKQYEYKNHGKPYSPANFEDYYMGVIPLRKGLVFSLNNATIRLGLLTGLKNVADTAKGFGMEYDIKPYLAMPLGIFPVTPLNLAKVYAALGSYGVKKDIGFIMDVRDAGGRPVYIDRKIPERIVPETAAFQALHIMQDVPRIGTARGSGLMPGTAAKTGTTDEYKDAWTVAVFPPYAVVAWVGYDDSRSMGEKGTGGALAAPVIASFQRRILPDGQKIDFQVPQGIVLKYIDSYRGAVVGSLCRSRRMIEEAFAEDNLPADCEVSQAESGKNLIKTARN